MTAAELLVRCLENEGVETIFGIPGEENTEVRRVGLVPRRHETEGTVQQHIDGLDELQAGNAEGRTSAVGHEPGDEQRRSLSARHATD